MHVYNFTYTSDMSQDSPSPVIKHRTCDLSPVLWTILIELNSGFKNIDPQLPDLLNIMTFNFY